MARTINVDPAPSQDQPAEQPPSHPAPARPSLEILTRESEMGALVRNHDWSATPLGSIDRWSAQLRTAAQMVLDSPLPTVLAWGPALIALHNDAYRDLLGDKPIALGRPLLDVWSEVRDELGALFRRALAGEAIRTEGARFAIDRHGRLEQGFFDYGLSPVRDDAGVVVGVLNVAIETTGRVLAAVELRDGEARFRALVNASSDVVYRMSPDWTEMRQLEGGGFVADTKVQPIRWLDEALLPEDRPHVLAVIDDAVRTKGVFELEHRVRRIDGTTGWTHSKAVPVIGPDGGIVEWFGMASDVTERRQAAERLRASEARHRFRVELNDTLRMLTSPSDIMTAVAERLGRHLGVDQANYYLINGDRFVVTHEWRTAASPGMLGSHALADFADSVVARLRAGDLLRLDDSRKVDGTGAFAAFDIAAVLSAPLRSGGTWAGGLHVHSAVPRVWTDEQAALVRETADRAWAAMEHARAEAELRASEARYRQIVEGADDFAIITQDDAGMITSWNAGAKRLLGYSEDEAIGRSADVFFTPEDRRRGAPDREMSLAISDGRADNERWHVRKDGSRFWGSGLMMRLEQGGGFLKMFRDRTAEHEAEARRSALADLGDALRDLHDPTDIAFAAAGILGRTLGVSRVGYAAIDHDAETLHVERDWTAPGVGTLAGVVPLRDFGSFIDSLKRGEFTVIGDVRVDARTTGPAADALEQRSARSFVNAPVVEQGRLVAVFFVNHAEAREWREGDLALIQEFADRTRTTVERVRGQEALRVFNKTLERQVADRTVELRRFQDIVEATTSPICAFDTDYRLIAFNTAHNDEFRRVNGFDTKLGDVFPDLFVPEQRPVMRALMDRALTGERFTVTEEFGRPELGVPLWEISYTPLRDGNGAILGAFHRATDISDRLRAEAELAAAQEALRQSQKMEAMGQLTGGVAHDFNNLLTPIVGSLDMLQRRGVGGEREQRLIAGAAQSAERAKVLVQRLLAFARRQPLQPVAVDVARLVTGMADLVASTTGPQIKVVVDVANDLPSAKAEANQLEMALLNLAVNARDAMPDGGTLRISASMERVHASAKLRPGQYVRVSVADTGTGMDEATLARAIEPFFSTKGVGKGTGLGLSMVHGLASQLGGDLTIKSKRGLGTNIELWLPQAERSPETAMAAHDVQLARGVGTALLVDDEEIVRLSTADMLTDLGYHVVEAASAEEALRIIDKGTQVDLVVTDHLMPGMTGTDLARIVRTSRPDVPVLIISGFAEVDGVAADLPRLTKPFRNNELAMSLAGLFPSQTH